MAKVFIKDKGKETSFIDTSKAVGKWKATITCQGAIHSMVKMPSGRWFEIRHMIPPYPDAAFERKPEEVVKWFFEYGYRHNLPKEAQDMTTEVE
jgi:hypothetical protein